MVSNGRAKKRLLLALGFAGRSSHIPGAAARRRRSQLHPELLESRELLSLVVARVDGVEHTVHLRSGSDVLKAHLSVPKGNHGVVAFPTQFYAPYVDMSLGQLYMPEPLLSQKGIKYFNLAFVTAPRGSGTAAVWGGNASDAVGSSFDQKRVLPVINQIRARGGDVMVVFGGAEAGGFSYDLAQRITNVATLAQTYLQVINTYNVTHVDFDVEDAALYDSASIQRRSEAIAIVQQELAAQGKNLQVWFTLPSNPETGLTAQGVGVIQSAITAGVKVSGVNVMAMDFGTYYAAEKPGQMGAFVISTANNFFSQLQRLYPSLTTAQVHQMMGITPMIGQNDTVNEVFHAQDATMVEQYANQNGIGMLADWSLNRDRPKPGLDPRDQVANPNWSGIQQSDLEFAELLAKFTQ